jgi:hypothetical protein
MLTGGTDRLMELAVPCTVSNAPKQKNVNICMTEISCQMWLRRVPRTSLFLPLKQSEGEARRATTDQPLTCIQSLSNRGTVRLDIYQNQACAPRQECSCHLAKWLMKKSCNGLTTDLITSEFTVAQFYKHTGSRGETNNTKWLQQQQRNSYKLATRWKWVRCEVVFMNSKNMCLGCERGGPETSDVL